MSNQYDFDEEQRLKNFANETVQIADEYAQARYNYSVAKLKMDSLLADAYKNQAIKESLATEKAYIQLTIDSPEAKEAYDQMVKEEQAYKGLEKVINAREGYVTLHQSLLKNKTIVNGGQR